MVLRILLHDATYVNRSLTGMIISPGNLGRFTKGDSVVWKFSVLIGDAPTTLGATPVVSAYEDGTTAPVASSPTGGLTLTADFNSKTGLCQVIADTSNAAFN